MTGRATPGADADSETDSETDSKTELRVPDPSETTDERPRAPASAASGRVRARRGPGAGAPGYRVSERPPLVIEIRHSSPLWFLLVFVPGWLVSMIRPYWIPGVVVALLLTIGILQRFGRFEVEVGERIRTRWLPRFFGPPKRSDAAASDVRRIAVVVVDDGDGFPSYRVEAELRDDERWTILDQVAEPVALEVAELLREELALHPVERRTVGEGSASASAVSASASASASVSESVSASESESESASA